MDFRDHATRETAALIGHLLARNAEHSASELKAFRHALDAALRQVEASLGKPPSPDAASNSVLADKLAAAADARVESVRQASNAAIEALKNDLQASRTRLAELEEARHRDAASARDLQNRLEAASEALSRAREQADVAEHECARLHAEMDRSRRAAADADRALEDLEARRQTERAQHAQKWREHALTFLSLSFDRLLAIFGSVSAGPTATDQVLNAVLDALATEFSRVALFKVKRNRLEGVRQTGFDFPPDMSHVAIPRTIDSLLTRAVATGEIQALSGADLEDAKGTPFGGTPATVLALPIAIGGEPRAIVYADDADQPHREFGRPELRTKFAELVCDHAAPLLMWLLAEEKALDELREYATLLLTELEYTWAGDISAGRSDAERQQRLADSLDCARRLFAERSLPHGRHATTLFDDHITSMIDARVATPFGRDLAEVIAKVQPVGKGSHRTAEAS